jgi:hypothetical protein
LSHPGRKGTTAAICLHGRQQWRPPIYPVRHADEQPALSAGQSTGVACGDEPEATVAGPGQAYRSPTAPGREAISSSLQGLTPRTFGGAGTARGTRLTPPPYCLCPARHLWAVGSRLAWLFMREDGARLPCRGPIQTWCEASCSTQDELSPHGGDADWFDLDAHTVNHYGSAGLREGYR